MLSVKQAREILKQKADKLTDEEVMTLLELLQKLCNRTIDSVIEKDEI